MNLFELMYPRFRFSRSKTVRLFEAFSGVGCQAMALKRVTDDFELVGFSEIDKPAIQSYRAIHGDVKNYGDISKMETIPECDLFTWSFPCTDLSKAGQQKGLGAGTRSGLVYEVLRLLKNTESKPKVLIMENVPDLVQAKFVKQFNEIRSELEALGYTNYNEILNAKDYGVPQNRERVFMVSILADAENKHHSYEFPFPQKLDKRLKDLLEPEVDEKYYLSEKTLMRISNWHAPKDISVEPQLVQVAQLEGFESTGRVYDEDGLCPTINTMGGGQREPKVAIKTWNDKTKSWKTKEADLPRDRIYAEESVGFPITTNLSQMPCVAIKEDTKKGYAEAHDGDGVYINRPEQKRGVVQKGTIQTLEASGSDVIEVDGKAYYRIRGVWFRIRKLTPLECWRLMGIKDEDFQKAKASGVSATQLYRQAGNGIVVNVFEAILRELFEDDGIQ